MTLSPDEKVVLGYAPERENWDEDFAESALAVGGHLADDVALVLLTNDPALD